MKIHRGVISIEVMVVLFIVLMAIVIGLPRYNQYMQELEWNTDARQMAAVGAAAKSYIRDNRDTLISQVSGGTPVQLTGAQLQTAGYLPQGFALQNSAAQTYSIGIAKNPKASQKLVAFVLTQNGNEIPFKGLRHISQSIDGAGGYIQTAGVAEGAWGSWKMTLSAYGLTGSAGRLAVYLSSEVLGTDASESDRLYRYAVNGRPDLNRMHTAIDMNANDLNSAGAINARDGNFSNAVKGVTGTFSGDVSGANGNFNQKLNANSDITSAGGWLVTRGSFGWQNSTWGGGFYMSDSDWIRAVNNKNIYTGGQVRGGTVRSDGRLSTGEYLQLDAVVTAGTACPTNGLISRDASGAVMSCKNKIWTAGGSLQQSQCTQMGNWGGRDFNEYRCPVGWYAAGLQFVGHQHNESAYVITCCH